MAGDEWSGPLIGGLGTLGRGMVNFSFTRKGPLRGLFPVPYWKGTGLELI